MTNQEEINAKLDLIFKLIITSINYTNHNIAIQMKGRATDGDFEVLNDYLHRITSIADKYREIAKI